MAVSSESFCAVASAIARLNSRPWDMCLSLTPLAGNRHRHRYISQGRLFVLRMVAMYKVSDAGDGRKYFAQIPNIIDSMNLSVYAFRLYVHLKRVAGENGYCNESLLTLKQKLKISQNTIIKARRELEEPRDELGGKSLIVSETKYNTTGEKGYTYILINDIWPENIRFCEQMNASPDEALRLTTRAVTPHQMTRNASPDEVKEEQRTKNKEHACDEIQPKKDITPSLESEEENLTTADERKRSTEEALFRGIANQSKNGGLDLAKYPEEVRPVFLELYRLWGISPPIFGGKVKNNSRAAFWIQKARELNMTCAEFGFVALQEYRKDFEHYMSTHQGRAPHTVASPASLIEPISGKVGEMRLKSREVSQVNPDLPPEIAGLQGRVRFQGRTFINGKEIVSEQS